MSATAYTKLKDTLKGRSIKVVLKGKKTLNGETFTEAYSLEIQDVDGEPYFLDAVHSSFEEVGQITDIPIDLLEGFSFEFLGNQQKEEES